MVVRRFVDGAVIAQIGQRGDEVRLGVRVNLRVRAEHALQHGGARAGRTNHKDEIFLLHRLLFKDFYPRVQVELQKGLCWVLPSFGLYVIAVGACALLAQLDRASGFEPEGRRFESFRARQKGNFKKVKDSKENSETDSSENEEDDDFF